MKCLEYPFNSEYILTNKKKIKKELLQNDNLIEKRIAILGGSTTSEIKNIIELFLLNYGIKPLFYESEYNQFYQDIMFENKELINFKPDIIYIYTTNRNILNYPKINDSIEEVSHKLNSEIDRYRKLWQKCFKTFHCPIIQNNMEYLSYRLLGNMDAYNIRGRINFINKINDSFYEFANSNDSFYINDINYLSSCYGLDSWHDDKMWYMYKYSLSLNAIPTLAFSVSNIIKAIYGKNKKAIVLDLDNTLWGGVIGDDGVDGISIGKENALAEAYYEFQEYLLELKNKGVILNINSKNDYENAIAGLEHPDCLLKENDFVYIKANWNPKSQNMKEIICSLSLGEESFIFIDDNPAERYIINKEIPLVSTPVIEKVEDYIRIVDKNSYFETISISQEDYTKTEMYQANIKREVLLNSTESYEDYLKSLQMKAEIKSFDKIHISRISQLSNKSNQFNLTTKRYTEKEIEDVMNDKNYIKIYGKLFDVFSDNGLVSVIIGKMNGNQLEIELWIMSCRVLKRNMEYAMLDKLVYFARENNIEEIIGYYYPTKKNGMVKELYKTLGFELLSDDNGNTKWCLRVNDYVEKNKYIEVI